MFRRHDDNSIWPIGLMTLIATALLGMSMGVVSAPLLIGAPLALHLLTGWPRMPKPRMFFHLLLGVPFVLWFRYGLEKGMHHYVPITVLFVMGFYMLTLAVHHLLSLRAGGSKDHALGCTVLALGVAGAGGRELQWLHLPLVALFVVLLLVHLRWDLVRRVPPRAARGWAWPRYAAALVLVLGIAYVIEREVVPEVPDASRRMLEKLIKPRQRDNVGFDRSAKLGNLRHVWGHGPESNQEMLRVFAERLADPYLRGAAYDLYGDDNKKGTWSVVHEDTVTPAAGERLGRNIFNTESGSEAGEPLGVVYSAPELANSFFLPLGTHQIATFSEKVWHGRAMTMRPQGEDALGAYIFYSPTVEPLGEPSDRDLQLPGNSLLRRRLEEAVRQAMPEPMPTPAKLKRLEAWFIEAGYEYQLGVEMPPSLQRWVDRYGPDPVVTFMILKKGHCEYFASTAVLMLRTAGVPARYVTGFLADEPGAGGGWWVARRRHAHAWAEAWVEGQGWVRVEATPPDGRPSVTPAASASQRWRDWLAAQWERLKQLTLYGGLTGLMGAMWDTLMALPQKVPVWIWVLLITAGLGWIFRHNIRAMLRRAGGDGASERVRLLRQKLASAESRLARYGLRREPGTTPAAYLRAIRSAPNVPPEVRAEVLPLLDEYVAERFRRV